jgi:hypothetical protein
VLGWFPATWGGPPTGEDRWQNDVERIRSGTERLRNLYPLQGELQQFMNALTITPSVCFDQGAPLVVRRG